MIHHALTTGKTYWYYDSLEGLKKYRYLGMFPEGYAFLHKNKKVYLKTEIPFLTDEPCRYKSGVELFYMENVPKFPYILRVLDQWYPLRHPGHLVDFTQHIDPFGGSVQPNLSGDIKLVAKGRFIHELIDQIKESVPEYFL